MWGVSTIFILVDISPNNIFHFIFDVFNIPPDYDFVHHVLDLPANFKLVQLVYNANLPPKHKFYKLYHANLPAYYILNFFNKADLSSHNYELNQNHRISLHIYNYDLCNSNLRIPVW
jgi:hypothetical protein